MSAKFVQNGDTIDYTPEAAVAAGALVDLGFAVGVAKLTIAAGALGALALAGVFDVDVTALAAAVPVGTAVYRGSKDGAPTFDATTSDGSDDDSLPDALTRIGYVVAAGAAGDTAVRVRLG